MPRILKVTDDKDPKTGNFEDGQRVNINAKYLPRATHFLWNSLVRSIKFCEWLSSVLNLRLHIPRPPRVFGLGWAKLIRDFGILSRNYQFILSISQQVGRGQKKHFGSLCAISPIMLPKRLFCGRLWLSRSGYGLLDIRGATYFDVEKCFSGKKNYHALALSG